MYASQCLQHSVEPAPLSRICKCTWQSAGPMLVHRMEISTASWIVEVQFEKSKCWVLSIFPCGMLQKPEQLHGFVVFLLPINHITWQLVFMDKKLCLFGISNGIIEYTWWLPCVKTMWMKMPSMSSFHNLSQARKTYPLMDKENHHNKREERCSFLGTG